MNFLPGRSVMTKLAKADQVIWLDRVEFSKNGFVNRNRLPDGTWLTAPVRKPRSGARICDVELDPDKRRFRKLAETLRQRYRSTPHYDDRFVVVLEGAHALGRLVKLNALLLSLMLEGLELRQVKQSDLDRPPEPVSEFLAAAVESLDGDVYLSGPSGPAYLDREPFERRRIEIRVHEHQGPNHSAVHDLMTKGSL